VAGVAAFRVARIFNFTGWTALILVGFAALALYPWRGFLRQQARTFPSHRADGVTRSMYFVFLGILWLIILPAAAWLAVRAFGK
jgi:hypothetical protein